VREKGEHERESGPSPNPSPEEKGVITEIPLWRGCTPRFILLL